MKGKVLIIAEAGVNHNGDINLAKQLIDKAHEAGADIVKFQTFRAQNLVTRSAEMAEYQVTNSKKTESQFAMLKKLELSESEFIELKAYCEKKGIGFLSTGFDIESVAFLKSLGLSLWKIPSGEVTNLPYLEFIGHYNQPTILSTGMSNMEEVEAAINILVKAGTDRNKISVLHCNTDYPTLYTDVHLRAMQTMSKKLGLTIGYSDHTDGIEVSIAAVALGAEIIEKHFTLDKDLPGPDHKASLTPQELKNLVTQVRHIEQALGRAEKIPTENESKNIKIARKSIVAKKNIKEGEVFTAENLTTKRPGSGMSPMLWHDVLGTKAKRNYNEDELI